jgi:hypothetical protein
MSYQPGRPGKSTRQMAHRRFRTAIIIALAAIAIFASIILVIRSATPARIAGIGVLIVLFFFFVINSRFGSLVDRKLAEVAHANRGAQAEEEIGELLDELSDDFYVLNDVESPYGNIDHIVISQHNGVFLIETKSHHGRVAVKEDTLLLNGRPPEKNFIAQALSNAYWLRDEIGQVVGSKPWINPVLVFTNAFVPPVKQVRGVSIVNQKYLLNVLHASGRPNALNAQVWQRRENIAHRLMG